MPATSEGICPKLEFAHRRPHTQNTEPDKRNLKLQTRNTEPGTRNWNLETQNPKPFMWTDAAMRESHSCFSKGLSTLLEACITQLCGAFFKTCASQEPSSILVPNLLGPVDPLFRAVSGHLKLTVRRHKFNKDSLLMWRKHQNSRHISSITTSICFHGG